MKQVDYEVVKVIGRGAFGEVQLVRKAHLSFLCFEHHYMSVLCVNPEICYILL